MIKLPKYLQIDIIFDIFLNMSTIEKLIKKFFSTNSIDYQEVERILLYLGFDVHISGSHHVFRKKGYSKNISLKKRKILLPYQVRMIKEVLKDHGY